MTIAEFPQFAAAWAILFSVVIRWLRAGASWEAVDQGAATANTLRELTGIMELEKLQDVFGPPRLDSGVFPVTRREVMRERTGVAYLIGDRWLDGGSMIVALVTLMPIWPIWGTRWWLDTLLGFACLYQVAGWIATIRLVRRR